MASSAGRSWGAGSPWTMVLAAMVLAVGPPRARAAGAASAVVAGRTFSHWMASEDAELQLRLESVVLESEGYLVTGPLDPRVSIGPEGDDWFRAVRIVCPDIDALRRAQTAVGAMREVTGTHDFVDKARRPGGSSGVPGARGVVVHFGRESGTREASGERIVVLVTINQLRWLVWLRDVALAGAVDTGTDAFHRYASAVSDYLYACDRAEGTDLRVPKPPDAASFSLPATVDLYPASPHASFEAGAYRAYLEHHAEVHTAFARAVLGFVPTDSLVAVFEHNAPARAWPDREEVLFQQRYRTFFEREGDPHALRTLTAGVLAQLHPGEYFFAVGLSGKIRFGRLPSAADDAPAEHESGHKPAHLDDAFLFPGEPVLTAGVFTVDSRDGRSRITRVSARSEAYFYRDLSGHAATRAARGSDQYLLTLGHLFRSLDRLGISYRGVLVTKM